MKNKLYKFMQGRYGIDHLYMFIFFLYLILLIINMFIKSFIISIFGLIIIIIMFYRLLSKNIYKRSREEKRYLEIKHKVINIFKYKKNIDKEHVYKKCKKCKTVIRLPLPSSKGFKYVTCPKCKNRFKTLTLKKQKIEVIRKKKK